jgi:hypothetical protein
MSLTEVPTREGMTNQVQALALCRVQRLSHWSWACSSMGSQQNHV